MWVYANNRGLILAAALSAFVSVWAADSPMYRGGNAHSGAMEALDGTPVLVWRWTAERPTPNNVSSPAVVGNTLYVGVGSRFVALDTETGTRRWIYPSDEGITATFRSSPLVSDGIVYVGAGDNNLYAFNADTGKALWFANARSPIPSSPIEADGKIFFGSNDGVLHAVTAGSGDPVYLKNPFSVSDTLATAPIWIDGTVVVAAGDGTIYGVQASTAKAKWAARVPYVSSDISPILVNSSLLVAGGTTLYSYNAANGRQRFAVQFPADLATAPTADSNVAYVTTMENKVYAVDANTGRPKWKKPIELQYSVTAPATLAGSLLVVPQRRGLVSAFDTATGELKWEYVVRQVPTSLIPTDTESVRPETVNVTAAPVVANGMLFLVTEDGSVLAFSPKESVDLTPPDTAYVSPDAGDRLPGKPPLDILAKLSDEGSGIDPKSVKMKLDGEELETTYESSRGLVTHKFRAETSIKPWEDGRHTLTIEASDWAGNKLTKNWMIVVDNSLRRVVKKRYSGTMPGGAGGGPAMGGGPSRGGAGGGFPRGGGPPTGGGRGKGGGRVDGG